MSRNGKKGMSLQSIVYTVAALAVVTSVVWAMGGLSFVGMASPLAAKPAAQGQPITPSGEASSVCNADTPVTISVVGQDALQPGTGTSGTVYISRKTAPGVAGTKFSTSTSAAQGEYVDIFVQNGTGYHSAVVRDVYLQPCKTTPIVQVPMYANSSLTMSVWNSLGTAVLTNGGGANNATASSGETLTLKVRLQAQNLKSTDDLRCVLESNSATKMQEMSLVGFPGVVKSSERVPTAYTPLATTSATWVYDLSAITGSAPVEGFMVLQPKSGQSRVPSLC